VCPDGLAPRQRLLGRLLESPPGRSARRLGGHRAAPALPIHPAKTLLAPFLPYPLPLLRSVKQSRLSAARVSGVLQGRARPGSGRGERSPWVLCCGWQRGCAWLSGASQCQPQPLGSGAAGGDADRFGVHLSAGCRMVRVELLLET